MSKNSQQKEKRHWDIDKPKLDNARKLKKVAEVPELCTEFLANGIEADESKQWGIPIAEV